MKRTIALIIALAMLAAAFSGCSSSDIALYKAMQNKPESSITTTKTTFNISVEEPIATTYEEIVWGGGLDEPKVTTEEDDEAYANYILNALSGLLSVLEIETTTVAASGNRRTEVNLIYPDKTNRFTLWGETGESPANGRTIMTIPSYLRPFLPVSVADKQYITFDKEEYAAFVGDEAAFGAGIIGGADGPTAILLTGGESILQSDAFIETLGATLDFELTESNTENESTVYTLEIDSEAVTSIVNGIIKALNTNEGAALISVLGFNGDREQIKATLDGAEETADFICKKIAETGIFADGLTVKYTLTDGYITKTEAALNLALDLEKIEKAVEEIDEMLYGTSASDEDSGYSYEIGIKGKINVEITSVSAVASINEAVNVNLPTLTEENNISVFSDMAEYDEYSRAYSQWQSSWRSYNSLRAYMDILEEGETLVLRNNDSGAQISVEPKIIDSFGYEYLAVPAADLFSLFDGVELSWNDELMGAEVSYTDKSGNKCTDLYLNYNGIEKNYEEYDNPAYFVYDSVYTGYASNFTADGRFYVQPDEFDYDFGFRSRFEDEKFCYTSYEKSDFVYDRSMDGNIIYEFDKIFG